MYTEELYAAFVQLRKQAYKIKTTNGLGKYSQIELNKAKFSTFRKFYDEAQNIIYSLDLDMTVQEVFDDMLDKSQSRKGIKRMCF